MTELAHYQALSALLYLIIAVMFYRKVKVGIQNDKDGELTDIYDAVEIDHKTGLAVSKTVALVLCLLWPATFVCSAIGKQVSKGGVK